MFVPEEVTADEDPLMANHRASEQVAPLTGLMVATGAELSPNDMSIKF